MLDKAGGVLFSHPSRFSRNLVLADEERPISRAYRGTRATAFYVERGKKKTGERDTDKKERIKAETSKFKRVYVERFLLKKKKKGRERRNREKSAKMGHDATCVRRVSPFLEIPSRERGKREKRCVYTTK